MPEEQDQQSPAILEQIQAAERNVKRMVHAAEEEAHAWLEKARAQAKALVESKREALETRKKARIAEGVREAEREGERIVQEAQVKADDLKARGTARLDEAVALVLRRILPEK
jgi:V/A-type H+-transporting ATPase subunit G/H